MTFLRLTSNINQLPIRIKADSITGIIELKKYSTLVYFDGRCVEVEEGAAWIAKMIELNNR